MKHVISLGQPMYLLLHGTGGNEKNLIPLLQLIDPEAGYLGLRGKVVERGMNRFFSGLGQNSWDAQEIYTNVDEIIVFLTQMKDKYQCEKLRILGFSNGANIGAQLIVDHPEFFEAALLFKPLLPAPPRVTKPMNLIQVFISAATHDQWIPKNATEKLIEELKQRKANVHATWWNWDHSIHEQEINAAAQWVAKL